MSPRNSKRGLTLLELMIAIAVMGLVAMHITTIAKSTGNVVKVQPARLVLEDQARMVLDRIIYSLVGAGKSTLIPIIEGEHVTWVTYRTSLGVTDGEIVYDALEEIVLEDGLKVVWKENVDLPEERSIVWSRRVRALMDGEIDNDIDDNGNALIDEEGLSFTIDGDAVTVRLTLQRELEDGTIISEFVETVVACRF